MRYQTNEERLLRDLRDVVSGVVEGVGILARVFGRFKTPESINAKIDRKRYCRGARLMQDLVGIRVAVYFMDDLTVVRDLLIKHFGEAADEVRDAYDQSTFQPIRWNLVFRVPDRIQAELCSIIGDRPIEPTFEVQLRTVLAEGWHEVEHDLRYKRPEDWGNEPDLSRTFNGLLASLENADWTMLQLFEKLAYQKYKQHRWESMLRLRYRIRLAGGLSVELSNILDDTPKAAKALFRVGRATLIRWIAELPSMPLTTNNCLFLANRLSAKESEIQRLEPIPISALLEGIAIARGENDTTSGVFDVGG